MRICLFDLFVSPTLTTNALLLPLACSSCQPGSICGNGICSGYVPVLAKVSSPSGALPSMLMLFSWSIIVQMRCQHLFAVVAVDELLAVPRGQLHQDAGRTADMLMQCRWQRHHHRWLLRQRSARRRAGLHWYDSCLPRMGIRAFPCLKHCGGFHRMPQQQLFPRANWQQCLADLMQLHRQHLQPDGWCYPSHWRLLW